MPGKRAGRRAPRLRALLIALIAAAAAGLLALWAASREDAPSGEPSLRVASQRGGTKAMMIASGVLKDAPYRIIWSEFPAAQHLLEALSADAADVGAVGDAPFLFAYRSGAPIKAVQATRYDPRSVSTAILVGRDSSLRSAADLRGVRVATGKGSIAHYLLLKTLEREAIAPEAVTILFLSPSDAKAAFASGSIDAWATWNPYVASAILDDGARVLVDARGVTPSIGFMAASESSIASKPTLLADFLARNTRAQQWASRNPDAFAAVLARESGLPLAVARRTVDRELTTIKLDERLLAIERDVLSVFEKSLAAHDARPLTQAFEPIGEAPLLFRQTKSTRTGTPAGL